MTGEAKPRGELARRAAALRRQAAALRAALKTLDPRGSAAIMLRESLAAITDALAETERRTVRASRTKQQKGRGQ